jgi:hypothetical protein
MKGVPFRAASIPSRGGLRGPSIRYVFLALASRRGCKKEICSATRIPQSKLSRNIAMAITKIFALLIPKRLAPSAKT